MFTNAIFVRADRSRVDDSARQSQASNVTPQAAVGASPVHDQSRLRLLRFKQTSNPQQDQLPHATRRP